MTKTTTRKRKKHLSNIRIEGWDSRGNNLGFVVHTMLVDNLEAAIDEARNMYKENFVKQQKEMKIMNLKGEVLWRHKNWKAK